MKRRHIFIALMFTVFMFPVVGNINSADALGNYGCGNKNKRAHVTCLRSLLSSTPFGLTVQQSSPSKDGLGNYGCGNKNKRKHTKCLRRLLDQHSTGMQGNHGGIQGSQGSHGSHGSMGSHGSYGSMGSHGSHGSRMTGTGSECMAYEATHGAGTCDTIP